MKARYSAKRRTKKWKNRKKQKKAIVFREKVAKKRQDKKPPISHPAPKTFSFIKNTNEVLEYFEKAEEMLKDGDNVTLDISEVEELTPDTIALLVASVNDIDFRHKSNVNGNAPKEPHLLKLFTESGFYDHVNSSGRFNKTKENLLHKEVHRIVVPEIAKDASITGIKNVFGNNEPFEPLYNVLIECMSNTNNHADLTDQGKCNWWLYVCNNPISKTTSYSFLDLGVGIFESAVIKNYLKNLTKGTILNPNIKMVDDLLDGKIQSRIDKDKEIRGKGLPEIVKHSKSDRFKSFYIITNDVKINVKTREREQLGHKLSGTFLYWELG